MHCKHCILYTPSAVTWCRSSVSQNIHFRWKSTHYNNPFHKKHRTLYAEVDRYTISIKRFKLMCTFEGLLVMINLELLIHFPTEYIELRLFTFRISMCWQSHSSKFISILGVLDCSNEINSWQFLCNLMKTCSLLVWKKKETIIMMCLPVYT